MAIKVTGTEIQSDKEIFIEGDGRIYIFPTKISPFQTQVRILPDDYTLIQQGTYPDFQSNLAISLNQGFNGLKHRDANIEALKLKFKVPTPSIFLPHYIHVNEALNHRGVLYDADGNLIKRRLAKYADRLNNNCWAHLNAGFSKEQEKDTGFLGLDLVTITGLDTNGSPIFSRSPLEACLEDSCYAELESLNQQGFPTKKSNSQKYVPGKVIYFGKPYENSIAWFVADSGGGFLSCLGNPGGSNSALGVFLCAEGA